MKKFFIPIIVFILIATGVVVFRHQNLRQPSSVIVDQNGILQLIDDDLSKNENKKQIKRALLQNLDWNFSNEKSKLFVKIENIKLSSESNVSDFCTTYPQLLMTLEAPYVSYSGEHPEIIIKQNCESLGSIVPVEIDLELLSDFSVLKTVKAQSKSPDASIRIKNWDEEIPDKWRVKQIVFQHTSNQISQNFEVTKYEILSVLGYSIEFQTTAKKP